MASPVVSLTCAAATTAAEACDATKDAMKYDRREQKINCLKRKLAVTTPTTEHGSFLHKQLYQKQYALLSREQCFLMPALASPQLWKQ